MTVRLWRLLTKSSPGGQTIDIELSLPGILPPRQISFSQRTLVVRIMKIYFILFIIFDRLVGALQFHIFISYFWAKKYCGKSGNY